MSSCTNDQNSKNKVILAEIPDNFKFSEDLGASISVCEFRETNNTTKDYIVEGFIGGRKNPFAENRAIFILGDNTLETPSYMENSDISLPAEELSATT